MYAPISYGPLPFLAFKLPEPAAEAQGEEGEGAAAAAAVADADGSGAQLAAAGTLRSCDPDRIILKKITLTGACVHRRYGSSSLFCPLVDVGEGDRGSRSCLPG